jgi:hypothetical protein
MPKYRLVTTASSLPLSWPPLHDFLPQTSRPLYAAFSFVKRAHGVPEVLARGIGAYGPLVDD